MLLVCIKTAFGSDHIQFRPQSGYLAERLEKIKRLLPVILADLKIDEEFKTITMKLGQAVTDSSFIITEQAEDFNKLLFEINTTIRKTNCTRKLGRRTCYHPSIMSERNWQSTRKATGNDEVNEAYKEESKPCGSRKVNLQIK